jgi:hypothetical protein
VAHLCHKIFHDEASLLSLAFEMCVEDEDLLLQEVLEIFDTDLPILVSVCSSQPTSKEST